MAPTQVLLEDPGALGLPEILTAAFLVPCNAMQGMKEHLSAGSS